MDEHHDDEKADEKNRFNVFQFDSKMVKSVGSSFPTEAVSVKTISAAEYNEYQQLKSEVIDAQQQLRIKEEVIKKWKLILQFLQTMAVLCTQTLIRSATTTQAQCSGTSKKTIQLLMRQW